MAQEPTPLLLISDAISAKTGLARIARDLAIRIHANLGDVYRINTAGHAGAGSSKFGFNQYHLENVQSDWVLPTLPVIVNDFAGDKKCVLLFVWDVSRLGWLGQPERARRDTLLSYPGMNEWLTKANIERWIYCPIDAAGPNDKLDLSLGLTLLGFDRILAYGPFGEAVIRRTIGDEEADKRHLTWLPHGIDDDIFFQLDRRLCRKLFVKRTGAQTVHALYDPTAHTTPPLADDETLIGIVATNQSRKDWHLGIETCAILARERKIRIWIHTDSLEREWSIVSLLADYNLFGRELISLGLLPEETIAEAYSACDLTLGIGPEGFGFPLVESQFCGTPVVTGSYAGGADVVPKEWQVHPIGFRYEGSFACKRPVYLATDFAEKARELIGKRCNRDGMYSWSENWKAWEHWFREAVKS
jgi:glycosyltransferase involved in cell wall biosynthesis